VGRNVLGDFDGQERHHILDTERPYTRYLSFHALVARKHAIDYRWRDEKELENWMMTKCGRMVSLTRKLGNSWMNGGMISNRLVIKLK
jgi:hypothetical protein